MMETMNLKKMSGKAKFVGVALCLSGIMITSFYLGPQLNRHRFIHKDVSRNPNPAYSKTTWITGTILLIIYLITSSVWLILQGMLLKEYPSKILVATFQSLFGTIETFFVTLALERDFKRWQLSFNLGLLAIAYGEFVMSGLTYYLQSWCIEKKGAVFLAVYSPLALVFTMPCSSIFLGEMIHLGSVLGGIMMVGGLFGVLWGKSKDEETVEDEEISSTSHPV